MRTRNAWLQRGYDPIESAAQGRALGGAPLVEELAASEVAPPEETDAGAGEAPAVGLADRVALENAQPGHDLGDFPEIEIAPRRDAALAADQLPMAQQRPAAGVEQI